MLIQYSNQLTSCGFHVLVWRWEDTVSI